MFFVILNNAKLGTVRAITIDLRIADLKYFFKFATNFSCFCLVKLNSVIGILVRDRLLVQAFALLLGPHTNTTLVMIKL